MAAPLPAPREPRSLTRSPGLPSLPSNPSKPAGPCGDKEGVSEGGGLWGSPKVLLWAPQAMGTGPQGAGPASNAPQEHHDGSCPLCPQGWHGGEVSYLDAWGSGWSGRAWHPRGPPHALTALEEPQGVTGAAGHPLVTPQSRGQTWPPARGMSGATTQPRPGGTHPRHSPSRLRAPVARPDRPSPGSRGVPKEERCVEWGGDIMAGDPSLLSPN